jgi:hypothetical protein
MSNEPNFQTTGQTITLVMAEIYNDNKPLVNQKKTNPKRPKDEQKTNQNERKRAKFHPKNNPNRWEKTEKIGNCPLYRYNYTPQARRQGG